VDDRKPVTQFVHPLWDKLFGDKGYLLQPLREQLLEQDLHYSPSELDSSLITVTPTISEGASITFASGIGSLASRLTSSSWSAPCDVIGLSL
jgi:hypothetical protein